VDAWLRALEAWMRALEAWLRALEAWLRALEAWPRGGTDGRMYVCTYRRTDGQNALYSTGHHPSGLLPRKKKN